MTEYSFPIVGEPMSAAGWSSVTKGVGNGIIDQGGFPYRLTSLSNVDNTGVIKCPTNATTRDQYGQAILEGFYHRYDADITLSFPAVTKATTYMVVLFYDPSNATLPVTLKVVTSLDYSQGRNYLHLWNVVRQPNQLLTDAAVRMVRPRVAPVIAVASYSDLPKAQKTLWGTLAIVHNGRSGDNAAFYMAMTGDDAESVDGWYWKKVYDPNDNGLVWELYNNTDTYVSPVADGYKRAIGRRGKKRELRGRVGLASGATFKPGQIYNIMSGGLPASDLPERARSIITACGTPVKGSGVAIARVEVGGDSGGSTTGAYAWVDQETKWIGLDGVNWEVP